MDSNQISSATLPLVVQLAFVGSRRLYDTEQFPHLDSTSFHAAVQEKLQSRLATIRSDLGLSAHHRICGISSLASGGDTCFTQACQALNWPQRIALPQLTHEFLVAQGSDGPDFSPEDAALATKLLASPHLIETRVVSISDDRHNRFEDVNLELILISDVLVCLVQAHADGKRAGTLSAIAIAERRNRAVLEIQIKVEQGQPVFSEQWHWNTAANNPSNSPYQVPELPSSLQNIACSDSCATDITAYAKTLKDFVKTKAKETRDWFKIAALTIVGTHITATGFALGAVQNDHELWFVPWLLGIEAVLLITGFLFHLWLHRSHTIKAWAMFRLAAELTRSIIPVANVGITAPLRYLFDIPMPDSLSTLLHTLNVLHLQALPRKGSEAEKSLRGVWQDRCKKYVENRLTLPKEGQLDYYQKNLTEAERNQFIAQVIFYVGSLGAFVATSSKLWVLINHWPHNDAATQNIVFAVLGFLAVLLPAIAVAALSLAAAFDLEARAHTYKVMLAFLKQQKQRLQGAATENEFMALALETETRLLGETANWYARRAYTAVA